jgi:transcription elongation GreA/GreB family factor
MLPSDLILIKKQLHMFCKEHVQLRIKLIGTLITDIQDAVNNETKSSAGDKYETARETMQQEIEMNQNRLYELRSMLLTLEKINPNVFTEVVMPGSLAVTNNGVYYISVGAGSILLDGKKYLAISATSPIGNKMAGLKTNDSFDINGRQYTLQSVG